MSNSPDVNKTGPNELGIFGYTPILGAEKPDQQFQRGGPLTTERSIVVSEWPPGDPSHLLLAQYDPSSYQRSLTVMAWNQPQLRWNPVTNVPDYAWFAFEYLAEMLLYPAELPQALRTP